MIEYRRPSEIGFHQVPVGELLQVEVLSEHEGIFRVAKVKDSETLAVFNVNGWIVDEPNSDDPEAKMRLVYREEINNEGLLRGRFRWVDVDESVG